MELLKEWLDYSIIGILGFMSLLMVTFVVERYLYYRKLHLESFNNLHELDIALTDHLTIISTVGANAPYVGLLGTVLGILITFYDLGQGGGLDARSIMFGLALALKATALGLVVAIPAIIFYNALLRKVEVLKSRWQGMNA
ncbi:MAG: TonB-system energizer ExbB [Gammaproteobacteria bacterium]|nr:TonB-system energizer ExbB [Gammaproteobacteria bacterium]